MTIPYFTNQQFLEYLQNHGFSVISSDYFDQYNRIMVENTETGESFPLQYREVYYYPIVVKTCEQIGIPAPSDFMTCYLQVQALKKQQS